MRKLILFLFMITIFSSCGKEESIKPDQPGKTVFTPKNAQHALLVSQPWVLTHTIDSWNTKVYINAKYEFRVDYSLSVNWKDTVPYEYIIGDGYDYIRIGIDIYDFKTISPKEMILNNNKGTLYYFDAW